MSVTRREFLKEGAIGASLLSVLGYGLESLSPREALARAGASIKIGGCDWSLRKEGNPESFAAAKEAGLEGVEVSLGKGAEHLPMSDPERRKLFLAEAKKQGLPIPSTCLEILHRDNLKEHKDGPKWVEESIPATKALGARVILLPFFGKQAIRERAEQKAVAERLKPIAPLAEKAGVILGLENTISAEDNAWILDQVASSAVKVYYDVGNSFVNKFDVYQEVPWLGKDRICQIHLKDHDARLGQGKIDFPRFIEAVLKSGFEGWAMLETAVKTTVKEDFAANAEYVRGLLSKK